MDKDKLQEGTIKSLMNTKVIGRDLLCLNTIDSTNTECKRRAMQGAVEGFTVISDEQTGGRGRLGRSFLSPKGKGLYFSCILKPSGPIEDIVNLTAWVAVAACDAVEKTCGVRPQIKWTNDLILGGKKLAGILTEMEIEAEDASVRYVIPGIGINCSHGPSDFPGELSDIATSLLMETGQSVDRNALAANLAEALDSMLEGFPQKLPQYLEKYRKDCCTIGREVKLIRADGTTEEGYAVDIDEDFRLLVRTASGEIQSVNSGEVSVRGICGYL